MKNCLLFCFIFFLIVTGCKKLVEVESPPTALTSENIYTNDATAASVLTNLYASTSHFTPLGGVTLNSISLVSGLSADELTLYGGSANANTLLAQFYLYALSSGLQTLSSGSIWNDAYTKIYIVNIALENLAVSSSLTPSVKNQLMGEARFMRAFFYFYLTNLYGDVPLTTTSDYTTNNVLTRSTQSLVYQQIISDLKGARNLLTDEYVAADAMSNTEERVRPNKWVATALLARAYLYNQQYDSADLYATQVINNSSLYHLDSLNGVFLKNSMEAIWQLQPVNAGWNTEDARVFILPPAGPNLSQMGTAFPVYLSSDLINAFEPGDLRRQDWIDSVTVNSDTFYYSFKYKSATLNNPVTEYTMVLRLSEQYLIRAEAEAQGAAGGLSAAVNDLNAIRNRAGLMSYAGATDATSVMNAILHERQVEFFTEWGHRWLDLKRTGNADNVMNTVAPMKGTTWNINWQLYPIPLYDITQDPHLVQNPGYN